MHRAVRGICKQGQSQICLFTSLTPIVGTKLEVFQTLRGQLHTKLSALKFVITNLNFDDRNDSVVTKFIYIITFVNEIEF